MKLSVGISAIGAIMGIVLLTGLSVARIYRPGPVSASPRAADESQSHVVTQEDMDRWKTQLSNWGRWGKDDELGALNLITPQKRKEAAALVKEGFAVSLAHDALTEKTIDNPKPYEDKMLTATDISATDEIAIAFHGLAATHMDALAHHFIMGGKMYNGFQRSDWVTMDKGAMKESIENVKNGVFTRGVLFDLPRLMGVDYLKPGTPVYTEDLEAWEKKANIKLEPGDAVFFRTGRWTMRTKLGPTDTSTRAGLDASVIPWIRKSDMAVLGSEVSLSVVPFPPTTKVTAAEDYLPVHNFVIAALGITVVDNMDLDAVAEACAKRNRWTFLVTMAPIPLPHGTGSPVNPTALF